MSSSATNVSSNRSRVKLYTLNDERQWDDRGTGFVTCLSPTTPSTTHTILVKSEIDGSTLLESQIQSHTKYQKQQVIFLQILLIIPRKILLRLGNVDRLVRRGKL